MIVAILGGGQLARMMALAGAPLGVRCRFLDPAPDACAFPFGEPIVGTYGDPAALERLAAGADVVTYEFENVGLAGVDVIAPRVPVRPTPAALDVKQDRLCEKLLFTQLGIPVPPFEAVSSAADLRRAAERLGLPLVLKTRSLGYDGKGQWIVRRLDDPAAVAPLAAGRPLLAEQLVAFQREVSIIAVRSAAGSIAYYPLAENVHRGGILALSVSRPHDPATASARDYAERLLRHFDYVGVAAIEFFDVGGELLANEFAPRVHNSGHWTIEGAETSQFENHLRAVLGLPLGSTAPLAHVATINCIGALPPLHRVLAVPGAHLHVYGKSPRPGRKVGHITLRAPDAASLDEKIAQITSDLSFAESPSAGAHLRANSE
jgi:5-(carboxyamino)imidazole ribonucleotide synthase